MKLSAVFLLPIVLAAFTTATHKAFIRRNDGSAAEPQTVSNDEPSESTVVPSETQILQYALTLEHLENAFYQIYLAKFDADDFAQAGFQSWVRGRIEQISKHEQDHVNLLTSALGSNSVAPCDYSFPVTDPNTFVGLSRILEGVGESAYLGAAHFLKDASVITTAGSILTVEARHNGWITSSVNKQEPWDGSFSTPLDLNQVFTLASQFITSCPSSNAPLPVKAFPTITVVGNPQPGEQVTLEYKAVTSAPQYLAILSGLDAVFVPLTISTTEGGTTKATVEIPGSLQGTTYGIVTTSDSDVADNNTVAGPAILYFPFGSDVLNQ